jgi:ubiquinone/menaquinone biosynthesis C-methylase UbiE
MIVMRISNRLIKTLIETILLIVLVLDLIWLQTWIVLLVCVLYFVCDYLLYRREAVLSFKSSRTIRESMTLNDVKEIESCYTALKEFNTPEKRALTRPPLERYFYYLRYEQVKRLLDKYAKGAKRVLELGCGFGVNTFYICENLKIPVTGLDIDHLKLIDASQKASKLSLCKEIEYVTGDACHPPFKASSFDCILMTEVVEHLIHPEKGITASNYLLCNGGTLILTTPSSHNLNYSSNPFLILEKSLSLGSDRLLPPYHNLHAEFEYNRKKPEPQYGMHYHFSYKELSTFLRTNGFQNIFRGSFEIEFPLFPIIDFIFQGNLEKIKKYVGPIETILKRIPLLRYMGQHLILVARKGLG